MSEKTFELVMMVTVSITMGCVSLVALMLACTMLVSFFRWLF